MVHDISARLPAAPTGTTRTRQLGSAEMGAWILAHAPRIGRALVPTIILAVAAGMVGWLVATAAAALSLAPAAPGPLVVAFRVARWAFVAGVTLSLFRLGLALERRRWRREPAAA
jgi:hypothetical protein